MTGQGRVTNDVDSADVPMRVTVWTTDGLLAGGPLTVTWELRTRDGSTAYCALGGDRVRHRTDRMSFAAVLDGHDTPFPNPLAALADVHLGGPVAALPFGSSPLVVPVLVNQFLALEVTREQLGPGERGTLLLGCQWHPAVARSNTEALDPARQVNLDLTLRVPVHRDDLALRDLVEHWTRDLLQADRPDEDALIRLAALRHPEADRIATRIGGTAERIAWARETLRHQS